jgi:hypothetical protein
MLIGMTYLLNGYVRGIIIKKITEISIIHGREYQNENSFKTRKCAI